MVVSSHGLVQALCKPVRTSEPYFTANSGLNTTLPRRMSVEPSSRAGSKSSLMPQESSGKLRSGCAASSSSLSSRSPAKVRRATSLFPRGAMVIRPCTQIPSSSASSPAAPRISSGEKPPLDSSPLTLTSISTCWGAESSPASILRTARLEIACAK